MDFSPYYINKFKKGQVVNEKKIKTKSETGNIISIFDGDVTTAYYEKPEFFKLDDLKNFIADSYGMGYANWVATYAEDEGDIFVNFKGSMDGTVEDLKSVCFKDEDGDEEYWEIFVGDKSNLLCTSAFMSEEEVLENYPHLIKCNKA